MQVKPLTIYRHYFGEDFVPYKKYRSPVPGRRRGKEDTDASLVVYQAKTSEGEEALLWNDLGYVDQARAWPINLIMEAEEVEYGKAMDIYKKLEARRLGLPNVPLPDIIKPDPYVTIRTQWHSYELEYWDPYEFTIRDLTDGLIFPLNTLQWEPGGKIMSSKPHDPAFVYICQDNWTYLDLVGPCKILRPYTDPDFKWRNIECQDYIGGLGDLPRTGKVLFVVSSRKDRLVMKKQGFDCINPQGESNFRVFTPAVIQELNHRFEHIVSAMDGDGPGLKASKKLNKMTGWSFIDTTHNLGCHPAWCPFEETYVLDYHKDQAETVFWQGGLELQYLIKQMLWNQLRIEL